MDFSNYNSRHKIKSTIIREDLLNYSCAVCGISEWLGNDISLHLDHINGNRNDNRLSNLRFLCPNCHSQTSTYAGKKNKIKYSIKMFKVNDEELLEAMKKTDNPSKALKSVGLAGGGNYQRIFRLARKHNILNHMSIVDINKIKVEKLKESNIDNTKFGWINKVAKIIDITPQRVRYWLSKNYPDLLENSFEKKLK